MPIDMFGRPPENEGLSHPEYAIQLRDKFESSYDAVWQHHQKDHYDKTLHGNPYTEGAQKHFMEIYTEGTLVWLHSPLVPSGQSRKFHQP